jgi:hypothetical protein
MRAALLALFAGAAVLALTVWAVWTVGPISVM